MDGIETWEFNCPQFMDFCSGVEGTPRNLTTDFQRPRQRLEEEIARPKQLEFKVPRPFALKKRPLFDIKASTPALKSQAFKNTTDSDKCKVLGKLSKRLSKSDGSLNVVVNQQNPAVINQEECPVLGRHSVSEPDVRARKRCRTTPMCLKRAASTKKIKTTEELELEKIAELRKQTLQGLRRNEMNLKRIKMNKNPINDLCKRAAKIEVKDKEPCNKLAFKRADYNVMKDNINNFIKNARLKIEVPCVERARLNSHDTRAVPGPSGTNVVKVCQQPRPNSHEINMGQVGTAVRPKAVFPKLHNDGHSGLYFAPSFKKGTACKPFNFQNRIQELKSARKQPVKAMLDFNNKENKNAEVTHLYTMPGPSAKNTGKESFTRPRLLSTHDGFFAKGIRKENSTRPRLHSTRALFETDAGKENSTRPRPISRSVDIN